MLICMKTVNVHEAKTNLSSLLAAEQELTGGFHTEFSGMKWAFFMLSEYLGLTLNSAMIVVLFFGGGSGPDVLPPLVWFLAKTAVFIHLIILLRVATPRPRTRPPGHHKPRGSTHQDSGVATFRTSPPPPEVSGGRSAR